MIMQRTKIIQSRSRFLPPRTVQWIDFLFICGAGISCRLALSSSKLGPKSMKGHKAVSDAVLTSIKVGPRREKLKMTTELKPMKLKSKNALTTLKGTLTRVRVYKAKARDSAIQQNPDFRSIETYKTKGKLD